MQIQRWDLNPYQLISGELHSSSELICLGTNVHVRPFQPDICFQLQHSPTGQQGLTQGLQLRSRTACPKHIKVIYGLPSESHPQLTTLCPCIFVHSHETFLSTQIAVLKPPQMNPPHHQIINASRSVQMWCLGTWHSGGPGSVWLVVRLNGLLCLFQPWRYCHSDPPVSGQPWPKTHTVQCCAIPWKKNIRDMVQVQSPSPTLIWSFLCPKYSAWAVTSSLFPDTT